MRENRAIIYKDEAEMGGRKDSCAGRTLLAHLCKGMNAEKAKRTDVCPKNHGDSLTDMHSRVAKMSGFAVA